MPDNMVFVNIDLSKSKYNIDRALEVMDISAARAEAGKVLKAQTEIEKNAKSVGAKSVFKNGTNLILYTPFDKELIQSFTDICADNFGEDSNIGIGSNVLETHGALEVVDVRVKGIMIMFRKIAENLDANREFYKTADKSRFELGAAETIKKALLELNIITTDRKVYDIFMRLSKANNLNSIEELGNYFTKPLEEIKSDIRDIYQTQKTAGLVFAIGPQIAPGQSEVNKSRKQKSPFRRHNWLTREEYEQDQVDWRKTDLTYVDGNVTTDSQQMSMGGEPGNAINTN